MLNIIVKIVLTYQILITHSTNYRIVQHNSIVISKFIIEIKNNLLDVEKNAPPSKLKPSNITQVPTS